MHENINALKALMRAAAANPAFVHHRWFVKWHLEIAERIALELCDHYPEANRELVEVIVWLHDYGKMLDFAHEHEVTLTAGRSKLNELGFSAEFIDQAIHYIETLDKKLEIDLRKTPIEVQIVSSADGCSHMVGPFLYLFWHEATDQTFTDKTFQELMALNRRKIDKDWNRKIVLPEARRAFAARYHFLCEQTGELPKQLLA